MAIKSIKTIYCYTCAHCDNERESRDRDIAIKGVCMVCKKKMNVDKSQGSLFQTVDKAGDSVDN